MVFSRDSFDASALCSPDQSKADFEEARKDKVIGCGQPFAAKQPQRRHDLELLHAKMKTRKKNIRYRFYIHVCKCFCHRQRHIFGVIFVANTCFGYMPQSMLFNYVNLANQSWPCC